MEMEASLIESILEAFRLGGPWMYVILLADVMLAAVVLGSLCVAVGARLGNKDGRFARIFSVCTALACFIPMGAGALAMAAGYALVHKASQAAAPGMVDVMLNSGHAVAVIPMKFGGFSTLLLLLPVAGAFFLAPRKEGEGEGLGQAGRVPE